jgi:cytoskeletal protein RodZ
MADELGDDTYVPVLIDLQGMGLEGMDGFLWELARKIVLSLRRVEGIPKLDRPDRQDFERHPRSQFEDGFLPQIIQALSPRRMLLMFDETDRLEERIRDGDLPVDVFDYLRSLIQEQTQLNFLFTLGNRIEEVRAASSQLFNLAVYRKISFLDPDFAEDLITGPVTKHYTYTPEAIERIYRLTSGQPYYTQLLCHNVFSRWANEKPEQIDVDDVEAVLEDAIEQATPNLQFAWDDSSTVEKALLAALADRMPHYQAGVMRRNMDRALRREKMYPPVGDQTTGLKRLFERDINNNQEPYEFRVGLMQIWLSQYKHLEWVHEELGEVVKEWESLERQRQAEAPTPLERARRWAVPVLVAILVGVLVLTFMIYQDFQEVQQDSFAAATKAAGLATEVAVNSTEVALSQDNLSTAIAQIAEAEDKGDSEEAEQARATATAVAATALALDATATAAVVEEATAVVEATQAAAANSSSENIETSVPTETPTPVPTATDTPVPPTPTRTPVPTSTPEPALIGTLSGIIAYPVFDGSTYNIYLGDVTDGSTRLFRREASQPAFNAAGSRIAFLSWSQSGRGIATAGRSGGNQTLITNFGEDKLPTWSPEGTFITFLTRRSGNRASELYRAVDEDFRNNTLRYLNEGEYPTWGQSGDIVFKGWGKTGDGLRVDSLSLSNPEQLTTTDKDTAPALSPDGQKVVFMSQREGNWEIYLINADGSNLRRLTDNPANDGLPTWSPDGKAIAFVSNRDGAWSIMVTTPDGREPQKLFSMQGSPNGTVLSDRSNSTGWLEERISWAP